jgi:dienelactone hydrolase
MRTRTLLASGLALALAGLGGLRIWRVASELVDPPFYHPQPPARVQATFDALAAGEDGDPGGTWSVGEVGRLHLWTLRRRRPAPGHVLLLHGFGDDRWGTSPALKWFPDLDASIFTYRGRDEALRAGRDVRVTFGARESEEVAEVVHHLESRGIPRNRILLMGRSLGASVGLLALARLEREPGGPLGGIIWEGAPPSSRDFAERLVRGPKDRIWHPLAAPLIGAWASRLAALRGGYRVGETDVLAALGDGTFQTPSLAFLASQDRLAPAPSQRAMAARFARSRVLEVPTWHLNCACVLGPAYAEAILGSTRTWLAEGPRPHY